MIRSTMLLRIAAAVLLVLVSASPGARAVVSGQWVMGYYVGYLEQTLPPAKVDWPHLTHIVMSPMTARADGTLDTGFDASLGDGPALAKAVSTRAHKAGKKALLMLGGAGNGDAILGAVTSHRAVFIKNLIATMNSLGYDGIDLDWEDSVDWAKFQAFATALRKAAPKAILTVPVGPLNLNYQTVDPHIPAIAAQVDRIDVMSYYPATAYAGSGWYSWFSSPLKGEKGTTPVSIDTSLAQFVAAGVPSQKLGMGIAFYAICYTGGVTGPNQSTEGGVAIVGGDNDFMLSELYGAHNQYFQIYNRWDAAAVEPYMTLPTVNTRSCRYVTYEDERSILAKGQFSRANHYGGIIVWNLNEGYVATHPRPNFLMEALYKGFVDTRLVTPVAVSIMQAGPSVQPGNSQRLSALVTGTTNRQVKWSVTTAACGTVNSTGLYTAPAVPKNCTVQAASTADPTKTATVTVQVTNAP
ncbi:MAG TPA: glycosyl hydrolase family 18 protein [Alphaproteobacteria bacterium]|nr:glycosyl hydrolase family 18 protein [Alphaproteobacteria bacterium]